MPLNWLAQLMHRSRSAFTLIELMIVIALMAILAALTLPMMGNASDQARIEALASNISHVRNLVIVHAGAGDVPLSAGGFPLVIDPDWFKMHVLPDHAFTDKPMLIEAVNGAADDIYPAVKTFDQAVPAAKNIWYNVTNGTVCARVPAQKTNALTLELFNQTNKTGAAGIGQTQ